MATHSSVLAWRIPGTREPGGLPSMGSHRVGYDWSDLAVRKLTADGDCSHEIKRHLFLGRKVMTNLESILKSRDITLSTKVHLVEAMVFPVIMYGCESWTIKKAEHRRIDAFELWCWRRLLRVPWTARRSIQSILKEISPGCSLVGLMLKLKLQYFSHLMEELTHWKRPWCWERLKAGGERDDRGWDDWMASLSKWMWVWVNSGSWWWTQRPVVFSSWGHKESDTTEQLNWTEDLRMVCIKVLTRRGELWEVGLLESSSVLQLLVKTRTESRAT